MKIPSYRAALSGYSLCFFLLTFLYWGRGEVIAPHRQFAEIGRPDPLDTPRIENRTFSDFSNGYIPAITEHLWGRRSGWLMLWTNQTEIGRPVRHIAGFSPAYLPSWIIGQFTNNPWRFITILSLSTCFLTGLFVLLFCRELGMSPLTGLVAGSSLATSPFFMFWLTFPMFPAVWCWAAGALFGLTRIARKADLIGWSVLAFSVYSALMTAYPQPVVTHAYILAGFGLHLTYRQVQAGGPHVARFLALSASAVLVGALLAAPVYLDLLTIRGDSARVAPDPSFFTAVLPRFHSAFEALRFVVVSTIPELFGHPIETTYPFRYGGLSGTPVVIFFAVIGLLTSWRQTWGWWLAIAMSCALAFVHPLYILGIHYFGFNLSRSNPLGCILLPLTMIVAHGVEALMNRTVPGEHAGVIALAATSLGAVLALGVAFGLQQAVPIRWEIVFATAALIVIFVAQARHTRPGLLVAAMITVMVLISSPLMLHQDPARIAMTSPLVEKVRANLPAGSRFAVAAPGVAVLPPNLNITFGLPSIHSYNSLSSTRYHTLIKALGGKMQTYGRFNGMIAPDYNSPLFWMSNIGLILSPHPLSHENLRYVGAEAGVHLHHVVSRMGESRQITLPPGSVEIEHIQVDPRQLPNASPVKQGDLGDIVEFAVNRETLSLLVLSRNFHPAWHAEVFEHSSWVPAQTLVVNGIFQGVLLPPNTHRVRLAFTPYARYAWISHLFWGLLFLLLLFTVAWGKAPLPNTTAPASGLATETTAIDPTQSRGTVLTTINQSRAWFARAYSVHHVSVRCALVLFFFSLWLFSWYVSPLRGESFSSDLPQHIKMTRQFARAERIIPHPGFHYTILVLADVTGLSLMSVSVIVLGLATSLSYLAVYHILTSYLLAHYAPAFLAGIALILSTVSPIYAPFFNQYLYYGQGTPNAWHNPTWTLMQPFALWSFFLTERCLRQPAWRHALPTAIGVAGLLLCATFTKPSFALAFIPALVGFLLLRRWPTSPWSTPLVLSGVIIGPTLLLLAWQYTSYYGSVAFQGTTVVLAPFTVWGKMTPSIPVSTFLALAFPLVVLLLTRSTPRRGWWHPGFRLAWLLMTVAFLQFALLAESGRYATHANWGWGYIIALKILFVYSAIAFLHTQRQEAAASWLRTSFSWGALLLHFASGLFYLGRICSGLGFA
jgi:hypothetical protein